MAEYEAFDLVLQLLGFTHELGEAIQSRIEFWSGVSYGLIALAYIAPSRLTLGVGFFLLLLYSLFSFATFHNVGFDIETAMAGHKDILQLVAQHNLSIESAMQKTQASTNEEFKIARVISMLYVPGLFLGTIGYVGGICFTQWKSRKSK
jgi:hypothetical protein